MEGYNFSEFPKVAIQKFLKYAQEELAQLRAESKNLRRSTADLLRDPGRAKREILCHVIRGAADELKYRWRHNM